MPSGYQNQSAQQAPPKKIRKKLDHIKQNKWQDHQAASFYKAFNQKLQSHSSLYKNKQRRLTLIQDSHLIFS